MCVLQVIQLCFIVACMYTGVGLLRLGFMVRFLSHSVITGFTSGMQFLQTVKHTTAATASAATTTCSSPRNRDMCKWHPEPACTWPGYVALIHVNLRVASWPLLHGVVGLHSIHNICCLLQHGDGCLCRCGDHHRHVPGALHRGLQGSTQGLLPRADLSADPGQSWLQMAGEALFSLYSCIDAGDVSWWRLYVAKSVH